MSTFESDRAWTLPASPAEVWAALERTDQYAQWWPWLDGADLPPLRAGARARVRIAAPWGYRLRLEVAIDEVREGDVRRVEATVTGDLCGSAAVEVTGGGEGGTSRLRLTWELTPGRALLRVLAVVAHPVLVWGHDRVLDAGLRQMSATAFEAHDQRGRSASRRTATARAAVLGGLLSGVPSTLHTLWRGDDVWRSTRAAATVVGGRSVATGAVVHGAVSCFWAWVLAVSLPRRRPIVAGAAAGAAIAAVDLGWVARKWVPAVAALPTAPQVADHVAFGAVVGAAVAYSDRFESAAGESTSGNRRRTKRP